MNKQEMIEKRANLWKAMNAFLDTQKKDDVLSAEDDAKYKEMEKRFDDLTNEIKRMERMEAIEAELNKPVNMPIVNKPMVVRDAKGNYLLLDEAKNNIRLQHTSGSYIELRSSGDIMIEAAHFVYINTVGSNYIERF